MNELSSQAEYSQMRPEVAAMETCVQRLVSPDPAVNSEDLLFFHGSAEVSSVGFDSERNAYFLLRGSWIAFDSYFNAFPAHLYNLENNRLVLDVEGEGDVIIEVMLARLDKSWERLTRTRIKLANGVRSRINLPKGKYNGDVFVVIRGISSALIRTIDYVVTGPRHRDVSVTGVITTYKRNDAVQLTGSRLQAYFRDNQDIADCFSLVVVDNGGDTDHVPFENGEVIKNRNLGGAGGFTRGLKTAVERGTATHVLFMDDDASFFPESLRRTISLLRFTSAENLAISGAMITEAHKWRMWENGATFNKRCVPIDNGRDLRNFGDVVHVSQAQPRHVANKYGGWWYFCFPIASVKTWPFPFFVRGDDSYFSLANDFDIVTMLGVVAHQEDFFTKHSPTTAYLDFRYHLVHHLTFDKLKLSKKQLLAMMARYFFRYNNSYHYESASAINLAIRDVLTGSDFWQENADMAARRKVLAGMTSAEKVLPLSQFNSSELVRHRTRRNNGPLARLARKLTFNGHLLPDFMFYRRGIHFPLDVRAVEHDSFRRRHHVTADLTSSQGYVSRIDRKRYFDNLREFRKLQKEMSSNFEHLLQHYSGLSSTITTRDAWDARFSAGSENGGKLNQN